LVVVATFIIASNRYRVSRISVVWSHHVGAESGSDYDSGLTSGRGKGLDMNCKLCGRELESETEYCGFCKQIVTGMPNNVESHDRSVLRVTIGPEDAPDPDLDRDRTPMPTKSVECPDCAHTVFTVIGPKFDEPHEHNMLIVECSNCGFKGRMRWQGVARTTLRIKAASPDPPKSNADRE